MQAHGGEPGGAAVQEDRGGGLQRQRRGGWFLRIPEQRGNLKFPHCFLLHASSAYVCWKNSMLQVGINFQFFLFMQPLGFGSELKRPFSDLKVEDFLHREKQTMAVSHFFLLSICYLSYYSKKNLCTR